MATEEKVTYCRVCEPLCGMVATVTDGELTKVRPDPEHPLSAGFACPKGIAMTEVQNDPDRVLHPLRRRAGRLASSASPGPRRWTRSARASARSASATAATRSAGTWATRAPSRTRTRSGSRAFSTRSARRTPTPPRRRTSPTASPPARFLYGSPFIVPIPDLARTDFLLVVGANPLVSHGSVLSAPRVKDQLHAIIDRGGPRRGRRPAPLRDRARLRARRDRPGRRRLAAALDARGDLRRGARGPRRDRAPGARHRRAAPTGGRVPAGGDRGPQRRPRPRGAAPRPRPGAAPSAPPSTGAPAPAWAATGRWSRSCSTRSTWSPATSTARAGRCSATRRSTSAGSPTSPASAPTRKVRSRVGDLPEVLGSLPGVGDGEGDDDPRRGSDPGDVLLRRQPGALGAQRRRARGGDRRARALGRDRPLRHRHVAPLRLRAPGDDHVRARGLPAPVPGPVQHPVHPDDRGGGRAARRGAPGVGGDRGDLRADRRRALERARRPPARQGRGQVLAPAARRPAAARRAEGRPVRAPPRRPQPREAGAQPARDRARRAPRRRT